MSDNINTTNNICVSEDAFERFHGVIVCDDDEEFITLSDIVPTPQPTVDLTTGIDETQDDVCIVDDHSPQQQSNSSSTSTACNEELNTTNTLTNEHAPRQYTQNLQKSPVDSTAQIIIDCADDVEVCNSISCDSQDRNSLLSESNVVHDSDSNKDTSDTEINISSNEVITLGHNRKSVKRRLTPDLLVERQITNVKKVIGTPSTPKRGRKKKNESKVSRFQDSKIETYRERPRRPRKQNVSKYVSDVTDFESEATVCSTTSTKKSPCSESTRGQEKSLQHNVDSNDYKKTLSNQITEKTDLSTSVIEDDAILTPPKKRRGRPKKIKLNLDDVTKIEESDSSKVSQEMNETLDNVHSKSFVKDNDHNSFNYNNDVNVTTDLIINSPRKNRRNLRNKKNSHIYTDSPSESGVGDSEAKDRCCVKSDLKEQKRVENRLDNSDVPQNSHNEAAKRIARTKSLAVFSEEDNYLNVTSTLCSKETALKKRRGRPRKQNKLENDSEVIIPTLKTTKNNKSKKRKFSKNKDKSPMQVTKRVSQTENMDVLNDYIRIDNSVNSTRESTVEEATLLSATALKINEFSGTGLQKFKSKLAAKRIGRSKSMSFINEPAAAIYNTMNFDKNVTCSDKRTSPGTKSRQTKNAMATEVNMGEQRKSTIQDNEKYDEIELELERLLSTPTNILNEDLIKSTENNTNLSNERGRNQKEQSRRGKLEENKIVREKGSNKIRETDDDDDILLSSLKSNVNPEGNKQEKLLIVNTDISLDNNTGSILDDHKEISPQKRISKKPVMSDFEYNIDSVCNISVDKNLSEINVIDSNNQEIESKRPVRRKAKKILDYDEGSDEDPFANVELSDDDDDMSRKRGSRYYSDDEYIPGKKNRKNYSESSMSESDDLENIEETSSKKPTKKRNLSDSLKKLSQKKSKKYDIKEDAKPDVTSTAADTTTQIDDFDCSPQPQDITTNNDTNQIRESWENAHEFEDFIAKKIQGTNLQIKKLSGSAPKDSVITPLQIPMLDINEPKKTIEMCTQTTAIPRKTVEVQTTSAYESVMKTKVPFTTEQSVKACEFLKEIVESTSSLGQLMIEKSEYFINKKINTTNLTDTTKMEYCVNKSFLLFKLAKHNLIQMEEDLANKYDYFLRANNMLQYRESPKCITATPKPVSSDSDCEIIEEPISPKEKDKNKLNLKTVFLNKELSIKIAKKSADEPRVDKEKLNIKGRHTVWINDSILVKKVKPTQSFLAQDSRNKKPPDTYVTIEMVKNFFDTYYKRQQAILLCAPFVSSDWLSVRQLQICNYFITQSDDLPTHSRVLLTTQSVSETRISTINKCTKGASNLQPISLQTLCTKIVQKYMYEKKVDIEENSYGGKAKNSNDNNQNLQCGQQYQPMTLSKLSLNVIENLLFGNENLERKISRFVSSLNTLSLMVVNKHLQKVLTKSSLPNFTEEPLLELTPLNENKNKSIINRKMKRNMKTLFSHCVELIQGTKLCTSEWDDIDVNRHEIFLNKIKPLRCIALDIINGRLYNNFNVCNIMSQQPAITVPEHSSEDAHCIYNAEKAFKLTIESVNTLSEDTFSKLPNITNIQHTSPCLENDDSNSIQNYAEYDCDYEECDQDDNRNEESNWVSRVQLQELKSCFIPNNDNCLNISESMYDFNEQSALTHIKIEPLDTENVQSTTIKTEPGENNYDDIINIAPMVTKLENPEFLCESQNYTPELLINNSYDEDAFESFASTSKMLQSSYCVPTNDEVFSQSALRVHGQYEPDKDDEVDTSMSLLVPQQSIEVAKDRLMQSSSDDGNDIQSNVTKKKRKIRSKTIRQKKKDLSAFKDKNINEDEVAVLTKKMQKRIRQEEKINESSDSEVEDSSASKRENEKKVGSNKLKMKMNEELVDHIQCNDVDSTENINDHTVNEEFKDKAKKKNVSRTSSCDKTRENISQYTNDVKSRETNIDSFGIQSDAPVELLECEPILPIMQDDMENMEAMDDSINQNSQLTQVQQELSYIDRHGWKCYPINNKDTKLYEHAHVLLEKLPEKFVQIYFKYQDIPRKDKEDTDIDRLTNLQSLHRNVTKENKNRNKINKVLLNGKFKSKDINEDLQPSSALNNEHSNELSASEDEGTNEDDGVAFPAQSQDAADNYIAKNSLMNDMDSDSEKDEREGKPKKSIKNEIDEERVTGTKCLKIKDVKDGNSLMLTADKMMNKELALLHAPVTSNPHDVNLKETTKKPSPKNFNKGSSKQHMERAKSDDDSSSEEEKQWVNTKEKLLKRMGKKQENPGIDDAKRAKIVSEFIEKRGDAPEIRTRGRKVTRVRRSIRKYLEKQKQMGVLQRELYVEYTGRKNSQILGKGRRNIRKVIDKKSLARSTVIANMEEFERKRRLNMQLTRLREKLGCEEGVNVLVINDELCLEYDFEEMRPTVTVHPFFTKVMKAHQYEGVKFMWDACFESLAMVQSGHPGSGCILAHCMGLGKTLQVLALLHTVLTHSGVGMQRVLVCCPLSTVLNWVDEIHKWMGPVTDEIKVFELSKLKKTYERAYQLEDWYKGGGIFIIGYELFRSLTTLDPVLDDIRPTIVKKIRTALLDPGPDMVICDEGHLLKNNASVLAVAMSRVATKRRIILTGTPMQNNLREYYCMVNFVKPSLLGTYAEYSNRFENPIMNGQHRDSREEDIKLMKARTHILHKVLEGCLQRQEASVLYPYLPKKYEYTVFIPPTKCQWDLYKHYIQTYAMQQKQSVLKVFHVLQKIWTHPQVLHNFLLKDRDERQKIKAEKLEDDLAQEDLTASEDVKPGQTEVWWLQYLEGGGMLESLESSNKLLVVFQLLEECVALGDKVLIFSTSLYTMDTLEYFLKRIKKWSLGREYYRLDGSVPAEVRQKWCREFNAENNNTTKLFLISTRAGCLGLNMTAANRVIILDTSWNPAHDIQSIFRVYRFGQKKDCYIYRLVAMGTMEQKIYDRSVAKQAVSCRVVDEQQIDRHFNMAELTELYKYDEEGASVEAGLAAGVADVALLRVAARARLHAVREHDSLLRGSHEQHLPEHERNAAWMQFQQEHANKEMQDRLMEASQGIQKIMEDELTKKSGLLECKTEVDDLSQSATSQTDIMSKGKKGKQREDRNASQQKELAFDLEKEETKVKMIMRLLIKHKFHTTKPAQDIAKLVNNVRRIVDSGGVGLEESDELTRSIASVMLQKEASTPESPSLSPQTTSSADIAENLDKYPDQVEVKHKSGKTDKHSSKSLTDVTTDDLNDSLCDENTDVSVSVTDDEKLSDADNSLLVPVKEAVRKQRGRYRKGTRGRLPKYKTSDNEHSTIYDKSCDETSHTSSSTKESSVRPKKSSRRSYSSNIEEILPDSSSKESSPGVVDKLTNKKEIKCYARMKSASLKSDCVKNEINKKIMPDDAEGPEQMKKSSKNVSATEITAQECVVTLSGKLKRKAALAAEQHLETLNGDDIITLDDGDDEWTGSIGKTTASKLNCTQETKKAKSNTPDTEHKSTTKTAKKQTENNTQKDIDNDNSILLSDDEDTTETSRSEKSASNNMKPEEPIALHRSILSNMNFVKIVAYAYQSNRMLDEDAALLAAQYSTQKALKEIDATGKAITSGPLYDIAVKVIGIDILKKMNKKNKDKKINNKNSTTATSSVDTANSNNVTHKTYEGMSKVRRKETKSKKIEEKERKKRNSTIVNETNVQSETNTTKHSASTSQPSTSNVVPVGMFKGEVAMNQRSNNVEECILPDDDVICGTSKNTVQSVTHCYKKSNSQPTTITSASSLTRSDSNVSTSITTIDIIESDSRRPSVTSRPQPAFLTISNGKLVSAQATSSKQLNNTTLVSPVAPASTNIPKSDISAAPSSNNTLKQDDTICLDSDDEQEAPTPTKSDYLSKLPKIVQAPVARNSNVVNMHSSGNVKSVPVVYRINESLTSNGAKVLTINPHPVILVQAAPDEQVQQKSDVGKKTPNKQMLSTTVLPADVANSSNLKKICKPGDIVRITKSGHIVKPTIGTKLNTTVTDVKLQPTLAGNRAQPPISTANTSRSNDPLSILENVIHIQADDYDTPVEPKVLSSVDPHKLVKVIDHKGVQKTARSSNIESINSTNRAVYTLSPAKTSIEDKPVSNLINKQKTSLFIPKECNVKDKKSVTQTINSQYSTKIRPKPPGSEHVASITIENVSPDVTQYSKAVGTIVVGSSRDIILRPKSKTLNALEGNYPIDFVANKRVKSSNSEPKCYKRKTTERTETSTAKKNKSVFIRPMPTLKDFNLDDIDDIIELE